MKLMTLTIAALTVTFTACSSSDKREARETMDRTQAKAENTVVTGTEKAAAHATDATFVTEVSFKKGSADVTSVDRAKLDELIKRAKATGEIDDIKVISWADQEYPSEKAKSLDRKQRNLAADRADRLTDVIKKTESGLDVDTYNMAERPGMLSRLFNTENARVKKSLEVAGIPTTESDKMPHKAGKSMVLVILK